MKNTNSRTIMGLFFLLVTTILGFGCCSGVKTPLNAIQRAHILDRQTISLAHTWNNKTISYCTGVFVTKRIIATANHCIEGIAKQETKEKIYAQLEADGTEPVEIMLGLKALPIVDPVLPMDAAIDFVTFGQFVIPEDSNVLPEENMSHGKVLALEPSHDLALIEVVGDVVGDYGVTALAREVFVGEAAHSVGHPAMLLWTHADGIVAALRDSAPFIKEELSVLVGPYVQVSVPVYYGNSGGGVFNDNGELIGICSFISEVPNSGFLIPVDEVRGLMIGQRLIKARI